MALPTIVAPAPGTVTAARSKPVDQRTEAECYEVFRAIKDAQFIEPIRAGAADVADVADTIRGWLSTVKDPLATGYRRFVTDDSFTFTKRATPEYVSRTTATHNEFWNGYGARPASAAGSWTAHGVGTAEGVTYRMEISPGTLRFEAVDLNRQDQTRERAAAAKLAKRYYPEVEIGPYPEKSAELEAAALPSRGEVVEWSAKSRSKMQYRIPGLDFSDWLQTDGTLAMVTLTLPGNWETLCPDGKTFKKMVQRFLARWKRKIGRVRGLWKLEFQGRGAPHLHTLMRIPALVEGEIFEKWLSRNWAECVDASREVDGLDSDGNDDSEYLRHLRAGTRVDYSGRDYTDPRRISQYFAGHSAKHADGKEYQHIVPEIWQGPGLGPGRFWGYWGLVPATVAIEVDERTGHQLERIARKVRKAQSWKIAVGRTSGKAKGAGIVLAPGWQATVEAPKPKRISGGRAKHRTWNRFLRSVAEESFQDWVYQSRTVNRSMGSSGGFVGGWLQVNDGIQLAYDIARAVAFETVGPVVPEPRPGSRRDLLQKKLTLAKEKNHVLP